jgi:serine protease AprX
MPTRGSMQRPAAVSHLALAVLMVFSVAARPANVEPPPKTERTVWAATAAGDTTDVLVQAAGYPDLSAAAALPDKAAKTRFVFDALYAHAARTQSALRAEAQARGLQGQTLWISNQLWLRDVSRQDIRWLAGRADVRAILADTQFVGTQTMPAVAPRAANSPAIAEWGVSRVGAPSVWASGVTGQGIVIANLDTGVRWDHSALKETYRGWNGVTATHDYNWYDGAGWNALPGQIFLTPTDDNGHGTHTLGTSVGDDGTGNQVGVAPGAQWIACRNMLFNVGSVARYTACFQFALAPTDVNGANPDPARAADITSNSWGCFPPFVELGCEVPTALITVTQALRDAGIMVVASAGNSGPGCGSVAAAPATLDQAFTVGATGQGDGIASFSSRGPSTLSGRIKPDLVAPGVSVRSSDRAGVDSYSFKSGTSMAAPHVAGVVALLWSAVPQLRGRVSETEAMLRRTASPLLDNNLTCAGVPGTAIPNNTYGHGMIDAPAAIADARFLVPTATLNAPATHMLIAPLTVTLHAANPNLTRPMTNAVLSMTLPGGVTAVSVDGASQTGDVLTWSLGTLSAGQAVTRTVVLSASDAGRRTFSAYGLTHASALAAHGINPPMQVLIAGYRSFVPVVLR